MKKTQWILLSFVWALSPLVVHAQFRSEKLLIAEKLESENKYIEAIDAYEEVVEENPTLHEVIYKLAVMTENYGALKTAQKWQQLLADKHAELYPKAAFHVATLLKKQGKYEKAIAEFEAFANSYTGFDKGSVKKTIKSEIEGCQKAINAIVDTSFIQRPLNEINSSYTDLAPIIHENQLYFSSIQTDSALTYTDEEGQEQFMQLWRTDFNHETDSVSDSIVRFGLPSWYAESENMAGGAFSEDGLRFYFSRCHIDLNRKNLCKIYGATKSDTGWAAAVPIKGDVNDADNIYSSTHPNLSHYQKRKKKRDVLYFSSNRPGGKGGYDLWEVELDYYFNAGKAKNLGNRINTVQNEITPFYDKEEQTLYFSSNGLGGYGGYDVFSAAKKGRRFGKPIQLNFPFNSSRDDFHYSKISPYKSLLVSNRSGAKNYYKEFVLDDIFLFVKEEEVKNFIALNTYIKDSVLISLDSALVELTVNNLTKTTLPSTTLFQVFKDTLYQFNTKVNGYINASTSVRITEETPDTLQLKLVVEKIEKEKEIRLKNIYFDFDSDVLTDSSKMELDSLLIIMDNNPLFKIEIGAHTDNKGRANYNLNLSQKRAESVVNFLKEKGIAQERLVAKGYGMNRPIAPNKNKDGSDNPKGRQLNRRIVFKIIGMIELPSDTAVNADKTVKVALDTTSNTIIDKATLVNDSIPIGVIHPTVEGTDSTAITSNKAATDSSLIQPLETPAKDTLLKKVVTDSTASKLDSDTSESIKDSVNQHTTAEFVVDSSNIYVSIPIDATVTKNRYRWLRGAAAQKIVCNVPINLKQLRVVVKEKTGATFKIVIVKAKNGKSVWESETFTFESNKAATGKAVLLQDIELNTTLPEGTYFIYPVLEKGQIAHLGNYNNENTFADGKVIIGKAMFTNQSSDRTKFKFKLKEEKGRMMNYGPFFKFVIEIP